MLKPVIRMRNRTLLNAWHLYGVLRIIVGENVIGVQNSAVT